jgi:hypothetical protein
VTFEEHLTSRWRFEQTEHSQKRVASAAGFAHEQMKRCWWKTQRDPAQRCSVADLAGGVAQFEDGIGHGAHEFQNLNMV